MCGRYAIYSDQKKIANIFAIRQSFDLETSYNVAPTENVSVICELLDGEKVIVSMRWGLIPNWQNQPNLSSALVNARFETLSTKPSFKQAARKRRCLIIADGFYEWRHTDHKIRQPYFIHRKDGEPFAMAGLWEKWIGDGKSIDSCCIITIDANEDLKPLHDRMPAIIKPNDYDLWLNPKNHKWDELSKLITIEPHNDLIFYEVSTKVNSAKFKDEDCIKPLIRLA